ncbi:MAG: hypothetical protein ABFS42_12380 [Candidatus Krumholzibacteriota bacterium]
MKKLQFRPNGFTFVVLFIVMFGASLASAQDNDRAGTVGLSAIMQTTQNGVSVPIWASHSFVIEPLVSLAHVSDAGTDLGFGVLFRGVLREGDVLPYLGLRIMGMIFSPEVGDSTTDKVFGPTFGGEYIFADAVSLRVEFQANYTKSDEESMRFGNPGGSSWNTATAVIATVYF